MLVWFHTHLYLQPHKPLHRDDILRQWLDLEKVPLVATDLGEPNDEKFDDVRGEDEELSIILVDIVNEAERSSREI